MEALEEHRWLQRLLGEWTYETEAVMAEGQPPVTTVWTETVSPLGDLWIVCAGQGDMPDGCPGSTLMTLGYDPARQSFVGTFIGSMMTWLWLYQGQLSPDSGRLVLDTEGPGFSNEEGLVKYRDELELLGPDRRLLRSSRQDPGGQWNTFMTATYRRTG